ncbi:MAG: alpha/beta hydrolase family protein [Acidimicrobiia bacterium]
MSRPGEPYRAVLLAHGAGSDRNAAALVAVDGRLAAAGIPSLRFDYPYRQAGRKAPDRAPVLEQATREAAAQLAKETELPPERLVLGGRSMGGRYCSMVAGHATDPVPALGLVLLGYPLHPAGKPEQLRSEHFPRLSMPVLFVSGDRDALAPRPSLEEAATAIPGPVTFHWLPAADHGYRAPRSSGRSPAEILDEVAEVTAAWVAAL